MKKLALLVLLTPIFAAGPTGFMVWKAGDLKSYDKKLSPKASAAEHKSANEELAKFPSYLIEIVHREGNGEAEIHQKDSEIFMIESGEATFVIGGTAVGSKQVSPNEVHGPSIDGGEKTALSAGDMVRVPVNTPHQMLVAPGKQITYIVVKEPAN